MKPDWKDAPEWANYRAKDGDGTWHWFKKEPKTQMPGMINHWNQWLTDGKLQQIEMPDETWWTRTLEKREAKINPIVGTAETPLGIEPMWINFENEDFTWDDIAKFLTNRFGVSDIEELIYLLQENMTIKKEKRDEI